MSFCRNELSYFFALYIYIFSVRQSFAGPVESEYKKPYLRDQNFTEKARTVLNDALKAEREKFFTRLRNAREARSSFETAAAVIIQALARGFLLRVKRAKVAASCEEIKRFYLAIRDAKASLLRHQPAKEEALDPKEETEGEVDPEADDKSSIRNSEADGTKDVGFAEATDDNSFSEGKTQLDNLASEAKSIGSASSSTESESPAPKASDGVLTLKRHTQEKLKKQTDSAFRIQCAFRRFVSRRYLQRRKAEKRQEGISKKILLIQCAGRRYNACKRVNILRERRAVVRRRLASTRIQTVMRRFLAMRRVARRRLAFMWMAARMIQCRYRIVLSLRKMSDKKFNRLQRLRHIGALKMQKLVRAHVAKKRVYRIRERKEYIKTFKAVAQMQRIVRGFIARRRVKKIIPIVRKEADERKKLLADEKKRAQELEIKNLLESTNIFVQAYKGDARTVDDIYSGLASDESHNPSEVDSFGDNIFIIASSQGHIDIVRKCILWGFDLNYRNKSSMQTAITAAASAKHFDIVQYLLSPPKPDKSPSNPIPVAPTLRMSSDDACIVSIAVATFSNKPALLSSILDLVGSSVLEKKHPESGETLLHAACKSGNIDMLRIVTKLAKPTLYAEKDSSGRSVYHYAAEGSLEVLRSISELDSRIISSKDKKASLTGYLTEKDESGKSAVLLAALQGRSDVLDFVLQYLNAGTLEVLAAKTQPADVDVGWSPADIDQAIKTAASNNVTSVEYLIHAGFDSCWTNEDTGTTIVMAACKAGASKVVDLLMRQGLNMTQQDNLGRTALHYCAMCVTESMLPFVLTHAKAAACKINGMSLGIEDLQGFTPVHKVAETGCNFGVELIVPNELPVLINKRSKEGITPLMIAALYVKSPVITRFLSLGADPCIVDNRGHSALWYLLKTRDANSMSAVAAAAAPLNITSSAMELIRAGCPMLMDPMRSIEDMRRLQASIKKGLVTEDDLDPVEVIALTKNSALLRSIPSMGNPEMCWRVVITCMLFDSCQNEESLYNSIMAGGGEATMTKLVKARQQVIPKLADVRFKGYNILGWCIALNHVSLYRKLRGKLFPDVGQLDDWRSTALHIAASYASPEMLDTVLSTDKTLLYEEYNSKGNSPLMEGMKTGLPTTLRILAKQVALPRRGLLISYDAWLLAICRRREQFEKNLQTGRIQSDDEWYFPVDPDGNYSYWYEFLY
jgi:ankyrin repeat protein